MDGDGDGDGISTIESPVNEVPALHSPPPSDDDARLSIESAVSSDVDLRAKIIKQVEYYFSDENLPDDKFLMKQVKKDKEGFVSISLIASFRKMKRLTKDSSLIIDSLKESSQLVISSDGKKVKRLHPLPSKEDKGPELCTVVVANLPEDHSVQNIQKIFGLAGSIKNISIHDPYATEDLMKRNNTVKLVSSKMYALVEYESVEAAEKAVAMLNDKTDWRNGLWVQPLQKQRAYGLGRKAGRGSDLKASHARVPVSAKEEEKNPPSQQHDDERTHIQGKKWAKRSKPI
ncbi:la-related protein 6A isoform X2 [Beta vulgaris subsp. vulgaris]|uniref:la-related protein 6A isoform X2 n=1 Tax=Beta vulgaris subsp. vulgaris TaxID=3555 RepID=UPI002036750A|nr:la-related protein 6A isoform X2 [Beta vulgaris subsp. vulgaris]